MMQGSIPSTSGACRGRRSPSPPLPAALALLLGLGCASVAAAKDRPRADGPSSQKGCEWAGPGFAKLEGSETCIKIGGSVRADVSSTSGGRAFWK